MSSDKQFKKDSHNVAAAFRISYTAARRFLLKLKQQGFDFSPLPHQPYFDAVVKALAAANLKPDNSWLAEDQTDPYTSDRGLEGDGIRMLSAYFDWHTGEAHPHGISLIWEAPVQHWQWAPRNGIGDQLAVAEPWLLPALPRWAEPAAVAKVVRELLADREVPEQAPALWPRHAEAQAEVDVWVAEESAVVLDPHKAGCDCWRCTYV